MFSSSLFDDDDDDDDDDFPRVICVKFEQCKRGILSNVVFCGCVTMSKNFIARTKPRDDDDDDIESRLLYVRVFLCFISFVMCCVERVERALDHFLLFCPHLPQIYTHKRDSL